MNDKFQNYGISVHIASSLGCRDDVLLPEARRKEVHDHLLYRLRVHAKPPRALPSQWNHTAGSRYSSNIWIDCHSFWHGAGILGMQCYWWPSISIGGSFANTCATWNISAVGCDCAITHLKTCERTFKTYRCNYHAIPWILAYCTNAKT